MVPQLLVAIVMFFSFRFSLRLSMVCERFFMQAGAIVSRHRISFFFHAFVYLLLFTAAGPTDRNEKEYHYTHSQPSSHPANRVSGKQSSAIVSTLVDKSLYRFACVLYVYRCIRSYIAQRTVTAATTNTIDC